MKTLYNGHEPVYHRIKAEGCVGWDKTEEAYRERESELERILGNGLAPARGRVLELGCGAGNISIWLARRGFDVRGVDIAPAAIDWAREKAQKESVAASFTLGNVLELGHLEEATADFVLDGHCLHCIIAEDRKIFLATAFRLLVPGGYLLIDTMCGPVVGGHLEGYDPALKMILYHDAAIRYFGMPEEIQEEISAAGFTILNVDLRREAGHGNMFVEARKPLD